MLRVFASANVATILAQWKVNVLDHDEHGELEFALLSGGLTHTKEAERLASCAWHLPELEANRLPFHHEHRYGLCFLPQR